MAKKTLYLSISGHGFGHIGQMAPILNKLAFEYGHKINFVIECPAQERLLTSTFFFDFKHIPKAADIGMIMDNSLDVLPQKSHRAYKEIHQRWPKELLLKSRQIDRLKADAVVSNVSYLTLAAAKHLDRPNLGICSLNWADIYHDGCHKLPGSEAIYQKALYHYQQADHFLIPTPGMPMTTLANRRYIGPLARLANRFPSFKQQLNLADSTRLVMVSMGGIPHKLNSAQWPVLDDVVWIDTGSEPADRADIIPLSRLQKPFIDVLAHCDLLLCKPGYGLFTEASCNGVPIIYMKRGCWSEEPYLVDWLHRHNHVMELHRDTFERGDFAEQVKLMLANNTQPDTPCAPTGVGEACGYILELLGID